MLQNNSEISLSAKILIADSERRERDADRADACLIKRHIVDWAGAVRKREMHGEGSRKVEWRGRWSFFACIDFFRKLCSVQGKIAGQKMDVLSLLHAMISI